MLSNNCFGPENFSCHRNSCRSEVSMQNEMLFIIEVHDGRLKTKNTNVDVFSAKMNKDVDCDVCKRGTVVRAKDYMKISSLFAV